MFCAVANDRPCHANARPVCAAVPSQTIALASTPLIALERYHANALSHHIYLPNESAVACSQVPLCLAHVRSLAQMEEAFTTACVRVRIEIPENSNSADSPLEVY